MRTLFLNLAISLFPITLLAQPDTEIYIFELSHTDSTYIISDPFNITHENPGYDNQPHFLPDGSMYYVSTRDGQTDIAQVEFNEYSWSWLTFTEIGSEYSPTPIPNSDDFSTIRLDTTGLQLLYRYSMSKDPQVLIDGVKVGYHCWINDSTVAAFVLGDPATLEICNVNTSTCNRLDENIGRSLHKIPETSLISYVSKSSEPWEVRSLDPVSGQSKKIINSLPGSEDMCWSADGTLFMGQDSVLYHYNPKTDTAWMKVVNTSEMKLSGISRLAINPEGNLLAIVITQEED